MSQLQLESSRKEGIPVLKIKGRFALEDAVHFGEELESLVDSLEEPYFIMDFTRLEHISSAAIGILVNLKLRLNSSRGSFWIFGANQRILEVFELTGVDQLLEVESTLKECIEEAKNQ